MSASSPPRDKRRARLEALEPRLLLSADLAPVLLDPAVAEGDDFKEPVSYLETLQDEAALSEAVSVGRREIVFVDSGVDDPEALLDELRSAGAGERFLEVVVLDSARDGIAQISEVLERYDDLDAIHIVSHGTAAAVQLGSTWLGSDNLEAHRAAIASWGDALSRDADLLFYGCDLAGNAEGKAFVASLGALTGADVAASDDLTGSALLGGDWDLEFRAGEVETTLAFSAKIQRTWSGVLAGESLWLSTAANVAPGSGAPGLDSWLDSEVLEFDDPNLTFEPGTTDGTFSSVFDISSFTGDTPASTPDQVRWASALKASEASMSLVAYSRSQSPPSRAPPVKSVLAATSAPVSSARDSTKVLPASPPARSQP